ncbi:rhomboid family intramembrane serine protease [Streptacidiphilus sp. ASG 303]|uniref:rhomboid family intramembrane serine protease n=1 Tax=Streptacidiphilus sp. ASG 303 TaxID=2896847 RepID=UPI001E339D65|nr:rhomboid family intramembrane serine protease [Streptacidiphilus sp. ASG 303]MCD0485915.1 rhomboid family intramembrane serine protease [Streptacidiphilus sp. ASG 303]
MDTGQTGTTTCYRHPKRESYVRCTRCDRFICPDCMREASVGHHCPECVREGNRGVREARTAFGGRLTAVPAVTSALIALNLLAYLVELARPGVVARLDALGTGLVGPDGGQYVGTGAPYPGFEAVGIAHGEWYRLVTSAFLHALPTEGLFGITHILFNMSWLWLFGRVAEEQLGRVRFLALYLLSAVGGSVAVYLISPDRPTIGASGAVFGLAAGWFVLTRRLRHDPLGGGRILVSFLVWMAISARVTSWQGHLGGLLTGGAVALVLAYAPRARRAAVQAAGCGLVLLVLVGLVVLKTRQLTGAA